MYKRNYYFLDFFLSGVCVNAEAATLFTFDGVFGLLKSFDAIVATLLDVFSLRAIEKYFKCK